MGKCLYLLLVRVEQLLDAGALQSILDCLPGGATLGNFNHGSTTRQLDKTRVGKAEGRGRHDPSGHSILEVEASEQRCEG